MRCSSLAIDSSWAVPAADDQRTAGSSEVGTSSALSSSLSPFRTREPAGDDRVEEDTDRLMGGLGLVRRRAPPGQWAIVQEWLNEVVLTPR